MPANGGWDLTRRLKGYIYGYRSVLLDLILNSSEICDLQFLLNGCPDQTFSYPGCYAYRLVNLY
jgi:hypothetical protein